MIKRNNAFINNRYFSSAEFDSPDLPNSGEKMDINFVLNLTNARIISNTQFIITSGYRTPAHNKKVQGVKNSSHLKGLACDIKISNSLQRYKIIKALLCCGLNRIGIYDNYIHVDDDPSKVKEVIWKN